MTYAPLIKAMTLKKSGGDLVGRIFDFALEQPISAFVDEDRVLVQLDRLLDERLSARWIETHLTAALERERSRNAARQDTVGDWIVDPLKAEIRALLERPLDLDPRVVSQAVQEGSVKHMLKSIVEETLERFISSIRPGNGGGSLLGGLGRGALGFASRAGKGLLGQLGGQVEEQLRGAVSSFVNTSTTALLDRLVAIITSDEMAAHLSETSVRAFDRLMEQNVGQVGEFLDRKIPLDRLLTHLPSQLSAALKRPEIRTALRAEVAATLAIEGENPVRSLFADDAQVAAWRAEVVLVGTPLLKAFAKSEAFQAWLPSD